MGLHFTATGFVCITSAIRLSVQPFIKPHIHCISKAQSLLEIQMSVLLLAGVEKAQQVCSLEPACWGLALLQQLIMLAVASCGSTSESWTIGASACPLLQLSEQHCPPSLRLQSTVNKCWQCLWHSALTLPQTLDVPMVNVFVVDCQLLKLTMF